MTATEPVEALGPEEGGGPPNSLMPWTLVVEGEDWWADLEHGAPVPRVGDQVEYIGEDGDKRVFRVVRVVHTVQGSSTERPLVRDEEALPNSTVNMPVGGPPRALRAGLPRVIVTPEES
jgi:hypothetical protein